MASFQLTGSRLQPYTRSRELCGCSWCTPIGSALPLSPLPAGVHSQGVTFQSGKNRITVPSPTKAIASRRADWNESEFGFVPLEQPRVGAGTLNSWVSGWRLTHLAV